jgi:hypothetical protein
MGTAPPPQAEVLHPARVVVGDACGVAHDEGADLVLDGEGDDLLGGLVLGLMDATAMAGFDPPQAGPVAAPAPRPALPRLRRAAGGRGLPCLLILEVQVALGAERPPRDQQPGALGDNGVGVDDAKVDPGHPTWVQVVVLDGDGGGDRQPQPPTVREQGDRADLLRRIWDRAGKANPQLGLALGDRQPYSPSFDSEPRVTEADRDQAAFAPREPGLFSLTAALGGLEPGVAVAAQHRPRADDRQLPERPRSGQLAAKLLVAGNWWSALLHALSVAVEQPRPHVPGRPQQPVAASGLPAGGPQSDRRGAEHQARIGAGLRHVEPMFDSVGLPVKACSPFCGQPTLNVRNGKPSIVGCAVQTANGPRWFR